MLKELKRPLLTRSRRILEALLDRDLTQSKIAEIVGANRSHITRVKNGEHEFSDKQLDKIEEFTGMPLAILLLGTEPPAGASAEVRKLHKEAYELVMESAAVRKAWSRRLK